MLCVLTGKTLLALAATSFSLSWTHSVEKTSWQENWSIEGDLLTIVEARVEGAGTGIALPDDAEMVEGGWRYRPRLSPLARLTLAASGATPSGWMLCANGDCVELGAEAGAPIVIWADVNSSCTMPN